MDVRTVKDLCQRLDELGTILELMEGEPVNVALHREASDALNQALSEIERLRSEADLHRETSCAMPLLRLNACSRRLPICNTPNLIEVLAIFRRR
jgi:hypothetical protein